MREDAVDAMLWFSTGGRHAFEVGRLQELDSEAAQSFTEEPEMPGSGEGEVRPSAKRRSAWLVAKMKDGGR